MVSEYHQSERCVCRLVGISRDSYRNPLEVDQTTLPLQLAKSINEMWRMDFVSDRLPNGRRIKCSTVAVDFSHASIEVAVDYGISGQYVTRILDRAAVLRG
jgi:hypothetical protein